MTTTTVTAEEVYRNLFAMYDLFSDAGEALDCPIMCTQCGQDDAYERFGTVYLCEHCLTLIGNVLSMVRYGIEADADGTISAVA